MDETKKITFRVSKSEHEKLKSFAMKQGLSINTLLKKAIQQNFNFKTQDIVKVVNLSDSDNVQDHAFLMNRNYLMQATFESLFILRAIGRERSEELVKNAHALAKQKISELLE